MGKVRKKQIEVTIFKKNGTRTEKQVGNALAAELTELAATNHYDADKDMIIIIGGEGNYAAAIEKALKYKWRIKVATYLASTPAQIEEMAKMNNELLQIQY